MAFSQGFAHRRDYPSFGVGRALHRPLATLPDDGESGSTTFVTQPGSPKVPAPKRRSSKRFASKASSVLTTQSLEAKRAAHMDWNAEFQAASEAKSSGPQLQRVLEAFEAEVLSTAERIVLARTAKPGTDAGIAPLEGCRGRYAHRGIYYLVGDEDTELVKFYGSAEAVAKAIGAEQRALAALWKRRTVGAKGAATVPLSAVVDVFGCRVFAVASMPISQQTYCGGPHGLNHVKCITHYQAHAAVEHVVHEQLHLPHVFLTDEHRTRYDTMPVLGTPELVVHQGQDNRTYVFEAARLFPSCNPHRHSALMTSAIAPTPPSSKTATPSALMRVDSGSSAGLSALLRVPGNRFSNAQRSAAAVKTLRPEALAALTRISQTPYVVTAFCNSIDGITPVAFTSLATTQENSLAAAAERAVVSNGIADTLRELTEMRAADVTPEWVVAAMHRHGLNLRWMGDVYREAATRLLADVPAHRAPSVVSSAAPLTARAAPTRPHPHRSAAPLSARSPSDASDRSARSAQATPDVPLPMLEALCEAIRIEAACRAFRVVVNEQWRQCLKPQPSAPGDPESRLAEAMVLEAAEKSIARGKNKVGRATLTERLLHELHALGDTLVAERGAELSFQTTLASPRLQRVEAAPIPTRYCADDGARFRRDRPKRTALDDVRDCTARLLTYLVGASPASNCFWETVLVPEVWLKFAAMGRPRELSDVPRWALLARACDLLSISLCDINATEKELRERQFRADDIVHIGARIKHLNAGASVRAGSEQIGDAASLAASSTNAASGVSFAVPTKAFESVPDDAVVQRAQEAMRLHDYAVAVPALEELVERLTVAGSAHSCDLAVRRAQLETAKWRRHERAVAQLWEQNALDGIVYVPCPKCGSLVNASQWKSQHRCPDGLAAVEGEHSLTIERLPMPLGLADGSIDNSCFSASSSAAGTAPHYARLRLKTRGWAPATADVENEWLQVSFGHERRVTGIALQGAGQQFARSVRLLYSNDGVSWTLFVGRYMHDNSALTCEPQLHSAAFRSKDEGSWVPVSSEDTLLRLTAGGVFANTDAHSVTTNTFEEPFTAAFIRVVPGGDKHFSHPALRVEVFVADDHPAEAAHHTTYSERVPLNLIDWTSRPLLCNDSAEVGTRRDLSTQEIQLLRQIQQTEAETYTTRERDEVKIHSTILPELYQRWIQLLSQWGAEREGDVTIATSRLALYSIGELELVQRTANLRNEMLYQLVRDVTPLFFALTKSSNVMELMLRRLHALFKHQPRADKSLLKALLKRLARWIGRRSPMQPYIMSVLAELCDDNEFVALCAELVDPVIADSKSMPPRDGFNTSSRDVATTHQSMMRVIEQHEVVALNSPRDPQYDRIANMPLVVPA